MLLSAVSILVVAQSTSEIPEGLMNNPVLSLMYGFTQKGKNQTVEGICKLCRIIDSSATSLLRGILQQFYSNMLISGYYLERQRINI